MRRATTWLISAESGLSLATVSRARKAAPAVRPDMARRVQAAAEKLSHRRSTTAANLRTGRMGSLALVLPIESPGNLLGEFGVLQRMTGGCARLVGSDHTLTLVSYGFNDPPGAVVEDLIARGVSDGLILTLAQAQDARVTALQARDIAFVTFGRTRSSRPHAFYDFDDTDFTYQAARLLIARGCVRPVLVLQPGPALYSQHRHSGFERALVESGLPCVRHRLISRTT